MQREKDKKRKADEKRQRKLDRKAGLLPKAIESSDDLEETSADDSPTGDETADDTRAAED